MIPFNPKKHAASTTFVFTVVAILLSFVLITCGDSHNETKICLPASLVTSIASSTVTAGPDSLIYVYGDNNRLAELRYLNEDSSDEQFLLSYSDEKLVTCLHVYVQSGTPVTETNVFAYGSNGRPSSKTRAFGSDPAIETVNYVYDDKDRLVQKETKTVSSGTLKQRTRYEYNDDNNVSKTYYIQGPGKDEIIGQENLSFDNHQPYYAGSPDLAFVETYIFDADPSINNVVSLNYYAKPGYTFPDPIVLTYTWTYDENGYVKSISFYNPFFPTELVSAQVNYTCR